MPLVVIVFVVVVKRMQQKSNDKKAHPKRKSKELGSSKHAERW